MKIVFCQAGSQLHDNAVLVDSLGLLYPSGQVAEFSLHRPAAAATAREIERAIRLVFGVSRETACALIECLFAIVAGATFFYDVALHYSYVVFVLQIYHVLSFS